MNVPTITYNRIANEIRALNPALAADLIDAINALDSQYPSDFTAAIHNRLTGDSNAMRRLFDLREALELS